MVNIYATIQNPGPTTHSEAKLDPRKPKPTKPPSA